MPESGKVKLNVDASVMYDSRMGVGMVVRDF